MKKIINLDHVDDTVCIVVDEIHENIEKDLFLIHSYRKTVSVIDNPEE